MDETPGGRSRRQKIDRSGRKGALEKFKNLKGTKNKYEVGEDNKVWEEVDESEYSRRVRDRQDEDWIVDDDGSGYVEDGREIFDDDISGEPTGQKKREGRHKKSGDKKFQDSSSDAVRSNNIRNMFQSMPLKKRKKESEVKLEDDGILNELLEDLHKPQVNLPGPSRNSLIVSRKRLSGGSARGIPRSRVRPVNESYHDIELSLPDDSEGSPKAVQKRLKIVQSPVSSKKSIQPKKVLLDSNSVATNSRIKREVFSPPSNVNVDTVIDELTCDVDFDTDFTSPISETVKQEVEAEVPEDSVVENVSMVQSEADMSINKADASLEERRMLEEWQKFQDTSEEAASCVILDSTNLPLDKNEQGEDVLNFYWIDAHEEMSRPGTVYLFGKVSHKESKGFISCCVVVKNIDRIAYVLPREKKFNMKTKKLLDEVVNVSDVYSEIDRLFASTYKIREFRSRRTEKSYAFDANDVPAKSEYLEVRYSAQYPPLPVDLHGETFSHVFGTTSTTLELFILNQKLKGPCWLQIKNPVAISPCVSWCKIEACVMKMEHISINLTPPSPPPVTVMSLVTLPVYDEKTSENEIVAVMGLIHNQYHLDKPSPKPAFQNKFCVVTTPAKSVFPFGLKKELISMKFDAVENERHLLSMTVAKINRLDPDIIIGHDLLEFDLEILFHRLHVNKVSNWSSLGRLRRQTMPQGTGVTRQLQSMCGRLLCDIQISARELLQIKSYDLKEITKQVLKKTHEPVSSVEVERAFSSGPDVLELLFRTFTTNVVVLDIASELNILPLASQITRIAGNLLSKTLLGGRSHRNEFLLLHAFTEKNYIPPGKVNRKFGNKDSKSKEIDTMPEDYEGNDNEKGAGRKKAAYTGGLVLEPKKGFYDKFVLLMDFNSLYPSIIQEYNLCFTTVNKPTPEQVKMIETNGADLDTVFDFNVPASQEPGILPTEVRKLVASRRQVKQLMLTRNLSPELKLQYEIRQKALKLMANSLYGCLGFSSSRFYAKHLAAMITSKGRQLLRNAKETVEKINLEVVYGDTDSIMINTRLDNLDEVMKLGAKIKAEINKLYRSVEIDIDGIFTSLLLIKKKKYAAVNVQVTPDGNLKKSVEVKGLDIVRRDWANVACRCGQYVIEQILACKPKDVLVKNVTTYLEELAQNIKDGNVPLQKLVITRQLTKNPEEYAQKNSLPQVIAALRMNSQKNVVKKFRRGDMITYIICIDGTTNSVAQRAYHIDEVQNSETLKPDVDYYLTNQIYPVTSRICDPIDELDGPTIGRCLGMDVRKYTAKEEITDELDFDPTLRNCPDSPQYAKCERLQVSCPCCPGSSILVECLFVGTGSDVKLAIDRCDNTGCDVDCGKMWRHVYDLMTKVLEDTVNKFYQGYFSCDNPSCKYRIRANGSSQVKCRFCDQGALIQEYDEQDLQAQLSFYEVVFDVDANVTQLPEADRGLARSLLTREARSWCDTLKGMCQEYLKNNMYNQVDLGAIFGCFRKSGAPKPERHFEE